MFSVKIVMRTGSIKKYSMAVASYPEALEIIFSQLDAVPCSISINRYKGDYHAGK